MRERPMHLKNIPFCVTDWETVPAETYPGDAGHAIWRTQHFGDIRVRLVDCSPGYVADHWCAKGHIIFCIKGEMTTDLMDGRSFQLKAGQSYQVADNDGHHRSHTDIGVKLFIVD
jgi:quercetin dioxygenase-like cupin family protein